MDSSPENILVTFQCTRKVKLKFYRPFTEEKNFFLGQKQRKILTKKKWTTKNENNETLKTLIRYIIGDFP